MSLPAPPLKPTVDTVDTVDTAVDMVDTVVDMDTVDTVVRGLPMPKPNKVVMAHMDIMATDTTREPDMAPMEPVR